MMRLPIRFFQSSFHKTTALAAAAAVVFYLLDQFTKELIVQTLAEGEAVPVIPGFFSIVHVTNPGAAWGILAGRSWLLLAISFAAFAAIVVLALSTCFCACTQAQELPDWAFDSLYAADASRAEGSDVRVMSVNMLVHMES